MLFIWIFDLWWKDARPGPSPPSHQDQLASQRRQRGRAPWQSGVNFFAIFVTCMLIFVAMTNSHVRQASASTKSIHKYKSIYKYKYKTIWKYKYKYQTIWNYIYKHKTIWKYEYNHNYQLTSSGKLLPAPSPCERSPTALASAPRTHPACSLICDNEVIFIWSSSL